MPAATVRTLATLEKVHLALEKVRTMRAAKPQDESTVNKLENAAISVLSFIAYNLRHRQIILDEEQNKVLIVLEDMLRKC
jgi:hypothetical protein